MSNEQQERSEFDDTEQARRVRACIVALNHALERAVDRGLRVDLDTSYVRVIGDSQPCPSVRAIVSRPL